MKHRIVSGLVLVPLMIVLSTTPAYAIFGSIIAAIQRAQMIVNQGVQIYNDAMEKITMNGQLTELTDQFSHLKEQALGTVGALTQPFTDLSSVPTEFIGVGLSWKNDFTGVAGELAGAVEQLGESGTSFSDAWRDRLTASNTISESDFLNLYADQSPEVGAAASRVYLVYRPESSRRHLGRFLTTSFVALRRKTRGTAASRASLVIKTHPQLTTGTSRTAH